MKKIAPLVLAAILALTLCGCSGPREVENEEVTVEGVTGLYTGTLENKLPNGTGKIVFKDEISPEWSFEGTFAEGIPEKGVLANKPITVESTVTKLEGLYTGESAGFIPQGKGIFETTGEDTPFQYEGEFTNGMFSGQGKVNNYTMTLSYDGKNYDGTYNGSLLDGKANGQGLFDYKKEEEFFNYEGEWAAGELSGKGKLKTNQLTVHFPDTEQVGTYEGDLLDGKASGTGSFSAINSEDVAYTYTGDWKDGLYNGKGVQKFDSDNYYIRAGTFTNGEFTPTPAEFFTALGSVKSSSWTVSDDAKSFIDEHQSNFLDNNNVGITDSFTAFDYNVFAKNSAGLDKNPVVVGDLRVVQIREQEIWKNTTTFMILESSDYSQVYYVYQLGKAEGVYEGDTVSICMLPLDYFTYKNVSDDDIWAVAGAGIYVTKS